MINIDHLKKLLAGERPTMTRDEALAQALETGEPVKFRNAAKTRVEAAPLVELTVEELRVACDLSDAVELSKAKRNSVAHLPPQQNVIILRCDLARLIGVDPRGGPSALLAKTDKKPDDKKKESSDKPVVPLASKAA